MSDTIQLNKRIAIEDESLINGISSNTELYVTINNDHLAYTVLDKEKNKYVALSEYRFIHPLTAENRLDQLQSIRTTDTLLNKDLYSKMCVSVNTSSFTLIPSHFYQKEIETDILALTCSIENDDAVFSDKLKYADAYIIYALDKQLLGVTGEWFDGAKLFFGGTALIESQLLLNKNSNEKIMTLNVRMHDYDIVVTDANKLLFYNSFRYQSSEDFIYYLLFTCEQLGLNPENIPFKLTGEIDKTSAAYFITSKYIRNISFAHRPDVFEFSYGFDTLPSHHHYSLFNQHLCVL